MYSYLYGPLRKYVWRGGSVIRHDLHELERSQWLSRSELERIQLKRIQRLVSYAYENVPFYRRRYEREGIRPQDIRTLEDFQSLPVLTRDEVKTCRAELVSRGFRGEVFEGSTSGSTGKPMRFVMEKSAGYWSYAVETRCRGWHGVRPGERMARLLIRHRGGPKGNWRDRLADRLKGYLWLDPRSMNESTMKAFAELLIKKRPTMFRVYPSALTLFAKYIEERGITDIKPKLIESTGEHLTASQRQLFEEVFGTTTADHYSSLEIFSIAYQCPQGSLHVIEDRYLELLEDGKVVTPGHRGEVTVTSLNQYAMPFIRYKNGDLGTYESESCPCGRGMPVLREISGRTSDVFVRPDGLPVHWGGLELDLHGRCEIYQYQVYQRDRCHLEVRLVCKQSVDARYLENVRNALQPLFGDSMQISLKLVDHIPPSDSGKWKVFVSDV